MGLFSSLKSFYKKSEAATVVQNLLEDQVFVGNFKQDPSTYATHLVSAIWEEKPDIFNGRFGQRPHKITVAAYAFAEHVKRIDKDNPHFQALTLSLGRVLLEVQRNGNLYPLNSLDHELLNLAYEVFQEHEGDLA